jgi:hypothetical protein
MGQLGTAHVMFFVFSFLFSFLALYYWIIFLYFLFFYITKVSPRLTLYRLKGKKGGVYRLIALRTMLPPVLQCHTRGGRVHLLKNKALLDEHWTIQI